MKKIIAVNCCAALVLLSGCAPYERIKPPGTLLERPEVAGSGGDFMYAKFLSALTAAKDNEAKPENYQALYREGKGLIDYHCATYFSRLGKLQQDLGYTRKETSLIGGTVTAILGQATASVKTVANTSALFSLGTSSMDAYQDVYLYSPDVGAIEQLVQGEMKKFSENNSVNSIQSWGDATGMLVKYEQYCQPQGIRHLINTSVGKQAQEQQALTPMASGVPATTAEPVTGANAAQPGKK